MCRRCSFFLLPKLSTYFTLTCWLNYSTREPQENKHCFLRHLPLYHTYTFSLCLFRSSLPFTIRLFSHLLHWCNYLLTLLLFLTSTLLESKHLLYLKFSYWSYNTDNKSKGNLFLWQDKILQLKKRARKQLKHKLELWSTRTRENRHEDVKPF